MNVPPIAHLILLPLAACNSGNNSPPPAAGITSQVKITGDNAVAAARTSFAAAFDVLTVAHVCAAFSTVPPPLPPPTTALATTTQAIFGIEGGSAVFTWEDADDSRSYSTGDTFSVAFTDYGESGLLLNGAVLLDNIAIAGDPLDNFFWTVDAQLTFVNLLVASSAGGDAETFAGSLRCIRESRISVITLQVDVEDSFVYRGTRILPGTTMEWHDVRYDLSSHWFADGAVEDVELGGVLTFATKYPLSSYSFFSLPFLGPGLGGIFEVFGSDGTSLQLVPGTDFTSLEIDVDLDGDGEFDESVATTWFEFTGDQ